MKYLSSFLAILFAVNYAYAQNSFPTSGDVFINTSIPVNHGGGYNAIWMPNGAALMPENSAAYAGISLTANIIRNSVTNIWGFANSSLPAWRLVLGNGTNSDGFNISRSASNTYNEQSLFYIKNNGNVGIGTLVPDAKLAVSGTIHAKEVKVDMTGWGDYLFKSTYHLPTLPEIKIYIGQHQHLPEMPSADEVEKKGVNLGEMVKLQTKKIEELTLYLIEKDNELNEQRIKMDRQEKRLRFLEKIAGKRLQQKNN